MGNCLGFCSSSPYRLPEARLHPTAGEYLPLVDAAIARNVPPEQSSLNPKPEIPKP